MSTIRLLETISSALETLRGAWRCDPEAQLRVLGVPLRLLALDIHGEARGFDWLAGLATLIMSSCYYWVFLISWIPYLGRSGALAEHERIQTIVVFSLGVASEIGPVKLICMYINRSRVRQIVSGTIASSLASGSASNEEMRTRLKTVWRRATIFWCSVMMNGVIYMMRPLFQSGRHMMADNLPVLGLQPMLESPRYEVAYVVEILAVLFTVIPAASSAAFLVIVAGHTEAQLHCLAKRLRQIPLQRRLYQTPGEFEAYITNQLHDIIQKHNKALDNVRQLEIAYQISVAIEFILLAAGLIAELLGGLENTYLQVPFALTLVSMDCLSGQRLMDAALEYERAIYDSNWERWDKRSQRTALNMLLVAQRRAKLSAGGIATLNFECLMAVLKSVYSAYTALRSVVDK